MLSESKLSIDAISAKNKSGLSLGLKFPSVVFFKDWKPKEEYAKVIRIQNVSAKTQKIKIKFINDAIFNFVSNENIQLGPGLTHDVQVFFAPMTKRRYFTKLRVENGKESEECVIVANSYQKMLVPDSVDFSWCAIGIDYQKDFFIKNRSSTPLYFKWSYSPLIKVSPESGLLSGRESVKITIGLSCQDASPFQGQIICNYGLNENDLHTCAQVNVTACGCYTKLRLEPSDHSIEIRDVMIDELVERNLQLTNLSRAKVKFQIKSDPNATPCINLTAEKSMLDIGESCNLKLRFSSRVAGAFEKTFKIEYDGSKLPETVYCNINSVKPKIEMSVSELKFDNTYIGSVSKLQVELINKSSRTCRFQTDTPASVFVINPDKGKIKANSSLTLEVEFIPQSTSNYFKTCYIMIDGHEVKELKLLGSCVNPIFQPKFVNFEDVKMWEKKSILQFGNKISGKDIEPTVFFDTEIVDFGTVVTKKPSPVLVKLVNKSEHRIIGDWALDDSGIFQVHPQQMEIGPNSVGEFWIHFLSTKMGTYGRTIECYIRMNEEKAPRYYHVPGCLSLHARGAYFENHMEVSLEGMCKNQQYFEIYSYPSRVSRHLVISTIKNSFDRAIPYKIYSDNPYFDVINKYGLVQANSFQLIPITFKTYAKPEKCTIFIEAFGKTYEYLKLQTIVKDQEYKCNPSDTLFFRPTCVNNQNIQTLVLTNSGPSTAEYEINVTGALQSVIKVDYPKATLEAHSQKTLQVIYKPKTDGYMTGKLSVEFSNSIYSKRIVLTLIATALNARVWAEKDEIDFGSCLINFVETSSISVLNPYDCDVQALFFPMVEGSDTDFKISMPESLLTFPAKSKKDVKISACLSQGGQMKGSLLYNISSEECLGGEIFCGIKAQGIIQSIAVCNIECANYPQDIVWESCSIDEFNEGNSDIGSKAEQGQEHLVWSLGSGVLNSSPTIMRVLLKNTGGTEVEWSLNFIYDPKEKIEEKEWLENDQFFTISPDRGILKPGEEMPIVISFKQTEIGKHQVNAKFKQSTRKTGIQTSHTTHLVIRGITMQKQSIHTMSEVTMIHPVSIKEKNPPLQKIPLFNYSNEFKTFSITTVDPDGCWDVVNRHGTIKPHSAHYLCIKFRPLKKQVYTWELDMTVNGMTLEETNALEEIKLKIQGKGVTEKEAVANQLITDSCGSKQIHLDSILPMGEFVFPEFQTDKPKRTIITITNRTQGPLEFNWKSDDPWTKKYLNVIPWSGSIPASSKKICILQLSPSYEPKIQACHLSLEWQEHEKKSGSLSKYSVVPGIKSTTSTRQRVQYLSVRANQQQNRVCAFRRSLQTVGDKVEHIMREMVENIFQEQQFLNQVDSIIQFTKKKYTFPPIDRLEEPVKLSSKREAFKSNIVSTAIESAIFSLIDDVVQEKFYLFESSQ